MGENSWNWKNSAPLFLGTKFVWHQTNSKLIMVCAEIKSCWRQEWSALKIVSSKYFRHRNYLAPNIFIAKHVWRRRVLVLKFFGAKFLVPEIGRSWPPVDFLTLDICFLSARNVLTQNFLALNLLKSNSSPPFHSVAELSKDIRLYMAYHFVLSHLISSRFIFFVS